MLIYLTFLQGVNSVFKSNDIFDSLDAPCLQQSYQKSTRHLVSVQCQVNTDFLVHLRILLVTVGSDVYAANLRPRQFDCLLE